MSPFHWPFNLLVIFCGFYFCYYACITVYSFAQNSLFVVYISDRLQSAFCVGEVLANPNTLCLFKKVFFPQPYLKDNFTKSWGFRLVTAGQCCTHLFQKVKVKHQVMAQRQREWRCYLTRLWWQQLKRSVDLFLSASAQLH